MKEGVRIGIIGTGKASRMHASALQNTTKSSFIAVCSRNQEQAEKFATVYGVRGYSDVSEMISENDLQMVIVCTPHPYHKHPTIEALEAGANVLVEKPLAASLKDCDDMINTAR